MRLAVHEEANDEDQESYASLLGGRFTSPPLRSALLKEVKSRSLRLYGFWMSVHQATTKSAKRVP